jgi:hypothetical protein
MISDVLFEAVETIKRYQARPNYESIYAADTRAEIDAVVAAMDSLRAKLDKVAVVAAMDTLRKVPDSTSDNNPVRPQRSPTRPDRNRGRSAASAKAGLP